MNEEGKKVLKEVRDTMIDNVSKDLKKIELNSIRRPVVILVLVLAMVGVVRDPTTLLIGIGCALVVLLGMSTSKDHVKIIATSMKKKNSEEEKAVSIKPETSPEEEPKN